LKESLVIKSVSVFRRTPIIDQVVPCFGNVFGFDLAFDFFGFGATTGAGGGGVRVNTESHEAAAFR
jgi:hypothetical protein